MNLLLTDRLICPRCGPGFGLILLADRIEDRRVLRGTLGCPNCRDRFPVEDGFGDLRPPPRPELPPVEEGAADGDERGDVGEATRLGALLGVTSGPGHVALVGPAARHAGALSDLLGEIEVVAVSAAARARPERDGVSRIVAGSGLPFFSGTVRGVVLSGEASGTLAGEAARVVAALGRVAVLDAPSDAVATLEDAGLSVILDEDGVVVASR